MAVFRVDKNFNVILNKDAVKLIPELASLTPKELMYVILVIDYNDSPFRKKPLAERKRLALRKIFGSSDKKVQETDKLKKAMELYHSLVFDIRRETIDVYNKKILLLQTMTLKDDVTAVKIKELDNAITYLQQRVQSIEHDLDIEEKDDNLQLKGGRKLSYLELWQRKMRAHKEYQESI